MANESLVEDRPKKKKKARSKPVLSDEEIPLTSPKSKNGSATKIDEVLQQAYLRSSQEEKIGKKKKKGRNALLENLKKGEGLEKDEDQTLVKNTFDPNNDPKSGKNNKKKHKNQSGTDNEAFDENEDVKKVKRKPKKKNTEVIEKDSNISVVALPPRPKPEEAPAGKKKKKKKPRLPTSDSEAEHILSGQETQDDADAALGVTSDDPDQTKTKKKKKKKKRPSTEEEDQAAAYAGALEGEAAAAVEEEPPRVVADEGRIVAVTVHRTDKLKTDFFISHPLVRVSFIDVSTGKYVKKQTKDRAVSSYYERERENVDMVLPIMTQPFDFKAHKSTLPQWEERLIFNENYDYLIQPEPNVMAFFEVLDMVSMNTAGQRYNLVKSEGGWHRIGWGFLKLVNGHGQPNTDKKARLQLYQPPARFRPKGDQPEIYQWWKSIQRIPYPSTLYVTVKGIIPPEMVEAGVRSMFATQQERGRVSYDQLAKTIDGMTGTTRHGDGKGSRGPSLWTRLVGQVCKVPNNVYLTLPAGRKGCFTVKFSNDGKALACGCHDTDGHPIKVYEIPSGKLKGSFLGHYSLVYDLSWSRDNKQLLSASADGTARVWDAESMAVSPLKTLPHPSFVYTALFHNKVNRVVVTGGYDRIIRVWSIKGDDLHGQLLQELDGHMSYVNSICLDDEGSKMYSADSLGQIRVWNVYVTDKPSSKGSLKDWSINREINDPEIKGLTINSISLHPNGRRLMVHCRDNIIRMFDLRVQSIMTRYIGALNFREQIRSSITPCGSFVVAGSEDNCAFVWNADTGDQVAMYTELGFKTPVCGVDFHPHDHMVAFSSFGDISPVLVYRFDHRVAVRDAGFETEDDSDVLFKRTGRPMSPEMKRPQERSDDEGLETSRSKVATVRGDFHANETARLDRIMKKLDSVSTFQASMSFAATSEQHPMGMPRARSPTRLATGTMDTGGWGSTFDSTGFHTQSARATTYKHLVADGSSPNPGAFSPHASRTMSATAQQQQHAAQIEYQKQGGGGWRPGFSSVGKRSVSPTFGGRTGQMSLNMNQGKPQFSFQGTQTAKQPKSELFDSSDGVTPVHTFGRGYSHRAVSLYDYQAQRSDEVSFQRGDLIKVLFKDNENWWMGELEDGSQGFFPANYVADYNPDGKPSKDSADELSEHRIDIGEEPEEVRESVTTAVVTKSGELRFLSGAEESDMDTPKKKKRARKPRDTVLDLGTDDDTPRKTTKKKKAKPKPRMYDEESNA